MKHLIIFISLIISTIFCIGQTLKVPIFTDRDFICPTVDSLLKSNVAEIIVFQNCKGFDFLDCGDSLLSYICWKRKDRFFVCKVTIDKVFSTIKFDGKSIFGFPDKNKTFVTKDEKTLQFTPYFTNPNALFYITNSFQGYFEQPCDRSPLTYHPVDTVKENIRKEWYSKIHEILTNENSNFKIQSNYKRDIKNENEKTCR